jgi:hypothetical protein
LSEIGRAPVACKLKLFNLDNVSFILEPLPASILTQGGEKMLTHDIVQRAMRVSVLGLIGMGLAAADVQTSFAGNCGGHCQAGKMCGDLVSRKGVKGSEKRDEYQKCMRDPSSYK